MLFGLDSAEIGEFGSILGSSLAASDLRGGGTNDQEEEEGDVEELSPEHQESLSYWLENPVVPWFLSADTIRVRNLPIVKTLLKKKKLLMMEDVNSEHKLAHIDRIF